MISKVSDLNSLFNQIFEDTLFVAREQTLMVNLVTPYSARGWMNRTIPTYPQFAAESVDEGEDYDNPQTFDKQVKAELVPGEVITQSRLTDRRLETDPEDARRDVVTEMGNAIATRIDVDLVSNFPLFTKSKGVTGASMAIAKAAAALSVLRTQHAMNPIYIVLHPYGWHDVWTELGQPAANQAFLGDVANEAMKSFFVGQFIAAQWFTSANIPIDGNADATGAAFNKQALAFDSRKQPTLEPERDASLRAWELNMTAGYAHGVRRDEFGVKLIHDATEPN